jgi:hypothetical protein
LVELEAAKFPHTLRSDDLVSDGVEEVRAIVFGADELQCLSESGERALINLDTKGPTITDRHHASEDAKTIGDDGRASVVTMEGLKDDSGEVFDTEKMAKWALTIDVIDGRELVDVTKASQLGAWAHRIHELTMEGCGHHRVLVDNDDVIVQSLV